jgi:DNA-binding MarR family transcriptional regulator
VTEQPFIPNIAADISAAAQATRARLDLALARAGITFSEWIALVTIWNATVANAGPPVTPGALRGTLHERLDDTGSSAVVLAKLTASGLIEDTDELHLTPAGEATFRRVRDPIERFNTEELAQIPAADLEITRRVLRTITERARTVGM